MDSMLHHQLGLRVLGAESVASRVMQARARHVKLCGKECAQLQYMEWQLREDRDTVHTASAVVEQLVSGTDRNESCSCQDISKQKRAGRIVENVLSANFDSVSDGSSSGASVEFANSGNVEAITNSTHANGIHNISSQEKEMDTNLSSPVTPITPKCDDTVTLLGLHACADLSPLMIRIFMCCSKISSIILLSCCYHKLSVLPSSNEAASRAGGDNSSASKATGNNSSAAKAGGGDANDASDSEDTSEEIEEAKPCSYDPESQPLFRNFPLSRSLAVIMCEIGYSVSVFGLRLACQEPAVRWAHMTTDEHTRHENALLYRAVLDTVCSDREYTDIRRAC